jgi:hypothetical protein
VVGRRSKLEWSAARTYDLLLRPLLGRAWLADRLGDNAGQLGVELTARREAEAELQALWSLVAQVQGLVLDDADGPSSLSTSMYTTIERLKSRIDIAVASRVRWGSRSALAIAVSHIPKLDINLEVLGSRRSARLTQDEVDALWSRVCIAVNSLASHVPSSIAHNPPDSAGEY